MIESTRGIILRTRLLTETSLIVHWLTPEFGRISTVAKGARRPKSPFAGRLELFYRAAFTFNRSRTSDLHNLRELKVLEAPGIFRRDLSCLHQASYAVAFVELSTESETPVSEIHDFIARFLSSIQETPLQPAQIHGLELKLLQILGMEPDINASGLLPGSKKIATALLNAGWEDLSRIHPSAAQNSEITHWLQAHLIHHLGRLPRGRAEALGLKQV